MNLAERVREIVAEQLGVDVTVLKDETSFDELNADSLDVVEMIMALEEEFELEIPDEDTEKIKTVGSVVDYIKEKK
ncbi:MAG: acyl carrier protein [Peptococcaceae bacterium]|jgi:acyl carrier protein|nr:acyl carrier protein [Peptococcaceae bacterium]